MYIQLAATIFRTMNSDWLIDLPNVKADKDYSVLQ